MKRLRGEMKTSWRALLLLAILLVFLILTALEECDGKGARTSRQSRTRSSSTRRKAKSSSKPKATKHKKQKTFHSSVTRRQTLKKRQPVFNERFKKRAAIGVVTYTVLTSPIFFRNYKPYHEASNIIIPKHRALKIEKEKYTVLAKDGSRCQNGSLTKYDEKSILNITTKVTYEKAKTVVGSIKNIPAVKMTNTKQTNLTLSADAINDYIVNIETRIAFNQSILENKIVNATTPNGTVDLTNCTFFLYESQAYVVVDESFAFRNKANFFLSLFALIVSIIGLK